MAAIDMSDAFDPDAMDRLVCKRQVQTVGSNGRAVNDEARIPFYGVVTQGDGDLLERGPEGERIKGSITITTPFRLTAGNGDLSADIVTWQGNDYTVSVLADYNNFGYTYAACVPRSLTGGA